MSGDTSRDLSRDEVSADDVTIPLWHAAGGDLAEPRELATAWLKSRALHEVVRAFAPGQPPPRGLSELAVWTAHHLDTRRGRERQDAQPVLWSHDQTSALLAAATPLGMARTRPPRRAAYDTTVVLAGTTTANRLRAGMADDLAHSSVGLGTLVALGSSRPLSDPERAAHPDSVSATEWHDLGTVTASLFGVLLAHDWSQESVGPSADLELAGPCGCSLRILCAPPKGPTSRADTATALGYLLQRIPTPGHLLLVTSAIYAPYTYFAAVGALSSWDFASLEVVGTPNLMADPQRSAQAIAQEVHSTVKTLHRYTSLLDMGEY